MNEDRHDDVVARAIADAALERQPMSGRTTGGAQTARRQIIVASAAIVLLLAAAVTVSIWRYEYAISQKDAALADDPRACRRSEPTLRSGASASPRTNT